MAKTFETFLWNSRLMVIVAVIASLVAAMAMLYIASIDAWLMISHLPDYANAGTEDRLAIRTSTVTHVVEIIDGYLLATVLIIFALGLYELFISKIEDAEDSANASKILVIHNLDDLKSRLAKVVLMILIVKFFEYANKLTFGSAIELLYLAAGIALIGIALYFSHAADKH
ncbi:MAG: YqhA family protein [Thiotrichaceae bacterium]|nr:YqhA family protein [Thiotrichaceae bacterium]